MTDGWLTGKRALIIGGGSGIGAAVVEAYQAEGATVAVLDRDAAKIERLPDATVGIVGEATSLVDTRAAVETTVTAFGGLDILVNCVGIFDFYRRLAQIADDELTPAFDEVFAVNVRSMLVSVKAALDPLRANGGSVVLTVSTSGFYPGRGGILYQASKFAVRGCVVALAYELAPHVRVNGVAPGGTVGTDMRGPSVFGDSERILGATPGRAAELAAGTPLRVALAGADHAGSYVFLASDRARGITGTFLHSDGGRGIKA